MNPIDFEDAVSRQQWAWLFELPLRLNVIIEVVDERHMPVFPASSAPGAAAFRRVLTVGEPSLRMAIAEAMSPSARRSVAFDGYQAVCIGLAPTGVLVLTRERADAESAGESRQDLELIGSWLSGAIERHLASASTAISAEPYRMASLARILSEAKSRGSARSVLGAFVEALDVWDRIQVRAYVAGARHGFLQYVSPITTSNHSFPVEVDDRAVPRHTRMVRLSSTDVEQLGLGPVGDDVLLRRIATGTGVAWLLVFVGPIDEAEQVRLTVYSDMLRESLDDVIATTTGRVVAAVTRQLPLKEQLEEGAAAILGELTAALGGHHGALVAKTAAGGQALAIGDTNLLREADENVSSDRLIVTASDAGSLTLVISREQAAFTALEREILESSVAVVHAWVRKTLERRRQFQPVDRLFEELAAREVQAGRPASVIVISIGAAAPPGQLTAWLGKIRGELRSWDYAGILSDSEIGVLLCDASTEQAATVCARLKQLLEPDDAAGVPVRPGIGVTTYSAESKTERSALAAARAGAAGHSLT
jgi:hypothetical protein